MPHLPVSHSQQGTVQSLRDSGFCLLQPTQLCRTVDCQATAWAALQDSWEHLPPDNYLRDGGHYRYRRHACYTLDTQDVRLQLEPHRAHWQPTHYNALHGGFERWFEPVESQLASNALWMQTLTRLGLVFSEVRPVKRWFIEAHQFRIDTANGVGRPTPEGAHRDGVDFVAVILIARQNIKGGETRVFDANGTHGLRFEMQQSLTALLLDDTRVIHETTPIFSLNTEQIGWRDTLVLTYRAEGFQAPS